MNTMMNRESGYSISSCRTSPWTRRERGFNEGFLGAVTAAQHNIGIDFSLIDHDDATPDQL